MHARRSAATCDSALESRVYVGSNGEPRVGAPRTSSFTAHQPLRPGSRTNHRRLPTLHPSSTYTLTPPPIPPNLQSLLSPTQPFVPSLSTADADLPPANPDNPTT
ncbi:hypothetical protein COP2_041910 [Malus domestica]